MDVNTTSPPDISGADTGQIQQSYVACKLPITQIPFHSGHIMPSFKHNLVGIGKLSKHVYKVLYNKHAITVFSKGDSILIKGWQEPTGAKIWILSLCPDDHSNIPPEWSYAPVAINAYNLPSTEALIQYFHTTAGFLFKFTWLFTIKAGNFLSWPGLTYDHAAKYCPNFDETIKCHMT